MIPASSLYSDDPEIRLKAAKALGLAAATQLRENIGLGSPSTPWPYGMPTSVNPYIVCLGISPGAQRSDDPCEPYDLPTVGKPHDGFGGNCNNDTGSNWDSPYWQKVRALCVGFVRDRSPILNQAECLALSGHLNLGTSQNGVGTESLVDPEVARWLPNLILKQLRPQILVCFGLRKLLSSTRLAQAWINTPLSIIINQQPSEYLFKFVPRYKFRVWHLTYEAVPNGLTVILWPNHPSRHPFAGSSDGDAWKAAITEAKEIAKEMVR